MVAENFQLLESRSANEQRQQGGTNTNGGGSFNNNYGGASQQNSFNQNQPSQNSGMPSFDRDTSDPFGSDASTIDISDDDLPF